MTLSTQKGLWCNECSGDDMQTCNMSDNVAIVVVVFAVVDVIASDPAAPGRPPICPMPSSEMYMCFYTFARHNSAY